MSDGCWVQFWDDDEYREATYRFDGPKNVNDLNDYVQSDGRKLGDEPDSLKTGSRTWITVYTKDDYGGTGVSFGPNSEIPDMGRYGVGGNISSFKMFDERPASFVEATLGAPTAIETSDGIVNADSINNYFRTTISASLNLIPVVGGFLGTLVGGLWPDRSNEDQTWACYQNYVNQAVAGVYWQDVYTTLQDVLESLFEAARRYVETPVEQPDSKRQAFDNLFDTVDNFAGFFVDEDSPERKLGFLVPFATLRLATLRENLEHYEFLHDEPLTPEYREQLTQQIQDLITEYRGYLALGRERVLARRQEMVYIEDDSSITQTRKIVVDMYDGSRSPTYYSQSEAEYAKDQYLDGVTNRLALRLDLHNATSQLWTWLDPTTTTPVEPPVIEYAEGPYGQYQSSEAFDCRADGGRISQVTVWAGTLVDAVEISVDGTSLGRRGGSGGSAHTLDLGSSKRVVSARGYQTGLINGLGFTDDTGQSIYGGEETTVDHRKFASGLLPDNVGGELVGISGDVTTGSGGNVKALTLHWRSALSIEQTDGD